MKIAHLDGEKLLGWYDSEIHTNIPTPNIQVSDAVWQQAISINANAYENQSFVVKDFSTPDQHRRARIKQLKMQLAETDYKVLPDYDKPDASIRAQRQAWREEIRQLEQE